MLTFIVLAVAGLGAGALNAVAGGGTFLSFPALVWAGVPAIPANATATLTALPGYLGSAWAFRRDVGRRGLGLLLGLAVLGGLAGAGLLLVTPKEVFAGLVPWLLLFATAVFAAGPWLVARMGRRRMPRWLAAGLLLAVCVYGGYFNGGLGIMLLAAFGLMGLTDLNEMNGLKNVISALLSVVSSITYAAAGLIDWGPALVLGLACAAGGYIGARAARRVRNVARLRVFISLVGLAMSAAFFGLR